MKNNFLSKAYGGVTVARRKLNGLGLPRQWKVMTSTLLLLFTFAIGNVWAADATFTFSSIFTGSNTSATVKTPVNASFSTNVNSSSAASGKLGSDGNYFQVILTDDTFTAASFNGYINTTNTSKNWAFQFSTDGGSTWSSEVTQANDGNKTAHNIAVGVTVPSGANGIRIVRRTGTSAYVYSITFSLAAKCSAPTNPAIAGTTAYTEGQTISLTASADGATSATFTWYKGADWATASAGSSIGSAATLTINTCATSDEGTYWCNISNGTGCEIQVSQAITVEASAAPEHGITYINTKEATNPNPATYKEGIGIASFDALADVTDFHFNGWSPASIAADATTDQTISATWVAAYNVSFALGTGASGTAPAGFQKWEGATFELPGQGSMVAPSGKAFDGWKANGAGDKLDAGSAYNMGNAAVEFVAQWKSVPVTIFHWKSNTGTITIDAANGTTTGGTTTLRTTDSGKAWGNESVTYNASVADDMKGLTSGKELKPGGNANYLELSLTSGTFQEGDVIYVTGYNNWAFMTSAEGINSATEFDVANIETGSGKGDAVTGSATIPAGINAATIYARRANGSSSGIAAIKVTRIVKDIVSTVNTLTDVKVNGTSISAGDLATLVSDHSLALSEDAASAPTITFNKHTVVTYDDSSTKTTDTPIEVTAADNGAGKWTASTTIDAVTYTVTLNIASGFAVTYNANGGSGTMTDANMYAAGEEVTVLDNAFTAPAANKKFNGWTSSPSVTITDGKFTMPSSAVELSAVWTEFFTITYMDGASTLGTEDVFVGGTPAGLSPAPTKPLNTFAGWVNSSDEDVNIAILDAATTVYAKWNKVYAQDADLEGLVGSEGTSADWQAYMSGKGYAYSTSGVSLDAKAGEKDYNNWPYQGLKAKEIGAYVEGRIAADKLVIIKLGHMAAAANVSLDGVAAGTATGLDADEPAGQLNYFYVENESVLRYETTNGGACVLKAITITNPFQVTFNANGGDPVASQYGHPAVTLPDASNGTKSLLGWFDAAEGGNKIGDVGESYTPAADIELFAQWEAVSTDARLASITFSSAAGTLEPAFDPEVTSYTYTMPYGTAAIPTITGATSVSAKAQEPQIVSQASAWGETAVIRGVAESSDTKAYNITMLRAPKDGISIIKVATTGGTNKTVTGLYAGDGDVNLSNSTKMDNGKYIGFTLDGTTLQAGDQINVHTTTAANTGGSHIIFYDNMTDKNELYETGEIGGLGDNIFTINAAMEGKATAYVYRSNADVAHQWNGYVDFIEVTRAMNPILKAITINSRAGEIDALNDHHFSVLIPYDADLAALTIVPTIVRNAPHATTPEAVISNAGDWIEGDNTYRVMDKDGDYTDYTITLTRDVLKHTVSFNTHGGSTIDPVQVVDGQKLAAAPADPTKDDYIFQGWAETEDGSIVDVTSFTISADKEFHAIWASDGAIKLIVDGATVNHTNFITGVTADETVEFKGNEVHYAKFAGTVSGVNGVKDLTRIIAYNATTNKTKIRIYAHNNSTSGRNILVKGLVEGASEAVDLATIALGNKEDKISDWIEFNNAANRTIYIFVPSSAGDVYFTQVKVIESGENAMKQAGEAGYSLNLNKGRFFGLANADLAFEGLNARLSGDYTALNSGYAKLNSTSMSFTVASVMTLSVTTANNKTYYVTKGSAGTDNETAKTGVSEFDLTAGTWYITAGSSEVQFTNIAFSAPKCEQPTVVDMENIGLCEGDAFTDLTVSASVTDGGTLHYQWYKHPAAGDDEAVGTDAATYTPTADGQYYVVVTNQLADHSDNSKASNMVTVEHFASAEITTAPAIQCKEAGQLATLTVVATGKAPLTYQWYTCDDEAGSNPVIIEGADEATYEVTVTVGMSQYYKVVVGSGCGSAEAVTLVEEWHEVAPANVTGSRTWDWAAENMGTIETVSGSTEYLMANVSSQVPNTEAFRSDMLYITANYANRSASNKFFQGWQIRFYTEVPGKVSLNCRAIHGTMSITINGTVIDDAKGSDMGTATTPFFVPAGWVTIVFDNQSSGYEGEAARVQKIIFNATPDYTRTEMLGSGVYGTICVDHNVPEGGVRGVTVYEIAGREPQYGKIAFDEVTEMAAGVPYVFIAHGNEMALYYGETTVDDPVNGNGMYGTFEAQTLTELDGIYYFAKSALWSCVDLTRLNLPANRAYVKLSEIDYLDSSAPAPGRKRLLIGVNGAPAVATGFENVQGDNVQCTKVLINGQLFILRGEKMYDAKGQLVK